MIENEFKPMGSMTLLNGSGDVTITWTTENEEHMRGLIEKKLKEGYSFFVVEKVLGIIPIKKKVTTMDQVKLGSKLLLQDKDAIRLFEEGKINVEKNEDHKLDTKHRTDDVDEILKSDVLAVRRIAAG
jgi:hypothetical protein